MCAILDTNAVPDVFGKNRTPAGKQFFNWIDKPKPRFGLATGGKLHEELVQHTKFELWVEQAIFDGRVKVFKRALSDVGGAITCKSNDEHVIALARVSKARVLYSHDSDLCQDFKNSEIVPTPPHRRILPTGNSHNAARARRKILDQLSRSST